jgi:hypothetical protein
MRMLHSPRFCTVPASNIAIAVPIPVFDEATRAFLENLLTRGTVLGQPHCGSSVLRKDSM